MKILNLWGRKLKHLLAPWLRFNSNCGIISIYLHCRLWSTFILSHIIQSSRKMTTIWILVSLFNNSTFYTSRVVKWPPVSLKVGKRPGIYEKQFTVQIKSIYKPLSLKYFKDFIRKIFFQVNFGGKDLTTVLIHCFIHLCLWVQDCGGQLTMGESKVSGMQPGFRETSRNRTITLALDCKLTDIYVREE